MIDEPLPTTARLTDVVRAIERSRRRIAVVVAEDGRLLGTLTDGDVRRCLLNRGSLDTPATEAMKPDPLVVEVGTPDAQILDRMKRGNVMTIPRVDDRGRFVDLIHLTELDPNAADEGHAAGFAAAVIMAGGLGTRLQPITRDIPKPMVEVDGMPLLERLVRRLAKSGVSRVFVSVNYLSHVIEDHLADGRDFGVAVEYLREPEPMGTAGALSLLDEVPDGPLLVMNGDIVTTSHFGSLFDFHQGHSADMTVAAIEYRVEIPYGVLRAEGSWVRSLAEKPSQRFLCNAGIYALSQEILGQLPDGYCNMTDLLQAQAEQGARIAVFPIHEYWSDIGTPDDLERVRATFPNITQP